MANRSVLYFEPDDVYADLFIDSVGDTMEVARARSSDETIQLLLESTVVFDAIVLGMLDTELVQWLRQNCQCPVVAAAWLPRDTEALVQAGCTHQAPRKENAGSFLIALFDSSMRLGSP